MFQDIQKAYEVLSDPKLRQIYDKYGSRGLQMMNQMHAFAPFLDPEYILMMNRIFSLMTLGSIILLLFPVFVSIRADKIVDWSWLIVFTPLFILDFVGLVYLMRSFGKNDQADEEEREKDSAGSKIFILLYTVAHILFQVFLSLKIDSRIDWSWWIVFAPWFFVEFSHLILNTVEYFHTVSLVAHSDPENPEIAHAVPGLVKFNIFLSAFSTWLFRLIQVILIVIRLQSTTSWSWTVVFVPFYVYGCYNLLSIIFQYRIDKRLVESQPAGSEAKTAVRAQFITKLFAFAVFAILFYTLIGLFVTRLNSDLAGETGPKASVILIPVFLVLSIVICCCGCCLPMLSSGLQKELEQEIMNQPGGSTNVVSPERRIENAV